MLKKKISFLTVLVMLATLFTGQIPAQAKAGFVESGYTIIDSAYNDGTYVVMAKNLSGTAAKMYVSADGRKWKETLSVDNAKNYARPNSGQELVYWQEENLFAAALGNTVYTSPDAVSWSVNSALSGISNAMLEYRDGLLVVAGGKTAVFAESLESVSPQIATLGGSYVTLFIGIESKNKVYISGKDYGTVMEKKENESGTIEWQKTSYFNNTTHFPISARDAKYVDGQAKWIISQDNKAQMSVMTASGYPVKSFAPQLATGENTSIITAIGANENVIFFATKDGKIYSAPSDAVLIASGEIEAQVWTEASPATGTAAIAEEVTDITALGGGEFFVTTATGVYNLKSTDEGYQYTDMLSYKEIGQAKVIGSLPFDGVTLLGGVYSPELNRYVVYGNDSDGKGHIYYSNNGIDWIPTSIGTQTLTWGFDTNAKNLAVWWPEQQKFVISVATARSTQSCWYSSDGISWGFMRKNGFGDEGDIQVMGKYLYTSYKGSRKAIRRFTALDGTFENIFYQRTDISPNCTTMAVSDDETPVILVGAGYGQTFINAAVAEGDTTKAKLITPGGAEKASSQMRDVHWNTNIDKFVGVNKINNIVYMIDRDASVTSVTPSADSGILAAIETNGSSYLTGGAAGKLYYSAHANISATSSFAETAFEGFKKNTLPVTNIFKGADGKYFATASDGKDNDILIVSADGSEYQKASELVSLASVSAGDTFTVSVKAKNYTSKSESIRLIAAIYDQTGTKLLQVVSGDKTMAQDSESVLSLDVTAAENVTSSSKMKVFIWDSINGMVPVAGEAKSFF